MTSHEADEIKRTTTRPREKMQLAAIGGHENFRPDDVKMGRDGGQTVPGRCDFSVHLLKFSCPLEPADAPEHKELSGEISALAGRSRARLVTAA